MSEPVFVEGNAMNGDFYEKNCIPIVKKFITTHHRGKKVIFWPDLATAHYKTSVTKKLKELKIPTVARAHNPPAAPQIRPIERLWSHLKQAVYEGDWEAETAGALKRRIRAKLKKLDLNIVQNLMRGVKTKLWRFRASAGLGSSSGGSGGGELQEVRTLERGSRPITCAAFHPSRPLVATGGWDGAVKIWDTTEMKRKAVRHGHDSSVRCLAISPDASYLVSGDLDGYLIVWGTKHGDWIQKSRVHDGPIQAACYLGPEKFVTAGADGDVKMWRSHVGSDIHQAASSAPVQLALAAPNGSLLTVTTGGEISLQPVAPPTSGDAGTAGRGGPPRWSRRLENVSRAACDQHRVYLAVGRAVLVLKMSDGKTERQLAAGAPVTSLACLPPEAPDSAMGVVLMGLEDGRVGVALADRGELVTTVAHAGEVTDIAVNVHDPERPRMATGGRDGMVLLWSGEDSWDKPYRSLEAYSVPVSALAWIDDQLVTAGQDSQMHLYPRPDDPAGERRLLVGNDAPVTALRAHVSRQTGEGGMGRGICVLCETLMVLD
ncbi:putative serine/threonine-protein kinase PkwA [Amphibalanus amphitrite]|uniref:Putative serine/threonine-protein kinase PkwA n=1 Tax=Amphibalanus amphitrite TaxID=1232801 RepID=A0A6A4VT80_AMPAM|nr:putative serine/threonine-protein kinase PkwA [Amphibalanus amphitrite]